MEITEIRRTRRTVLREVRAAAAGSAAFAARSHLSSAMPLLGPRSLPGGRTLTEIATGDDPRLIPDRRWRYIDSQGRPCTAADALADGSSRVSDGGPDGWGTQPLLPPAPTEDAVWGDASDIAVRAATDAISGVPERGWQAGYGQPADWPADDPHGYRARAAAWPQARELVEEMRAELIAAYREEWLAAAERTVLEVDTGDAR